MADENEEEANGNESGDANENDNNDMNEDNNGDVNEDNNGDVNEDNNGDVNEDYNGDGNEGNNGGANENYNGDVNEDNNDNTNDIYYYSNGDNYDDEYNIGYYDNDSFAGYVSKSIDPGNGLFLSTVAIVAFFMLVLLPITVARTKKKKKIKKNMKNQNLEMSTSVGKKGRNKTDISSSGNNYIMMEAERNDEKDDDNYSMIALLPSSINKLKVTCWTVLRFDKEAKRVLRYTIPFTLYSVGGALFDNICLAMIGKFLGSKHLAAYAIVILFVNLTDEFLQGTMHANTTLCAHAIGASNYFLAGQYVQLSIFIYTILAIPVALFWSFYTKAVVEYLAWGDEVVSSLAAEFAAVYIWSRLVQSISLAFEQLLEVTDHEILTTMLGLMEKATNVVVLFISFTVLGGDSSSSSSTFSYEYDDDDDANMNNNANNGQNNATEGAITLQHVAFVMLCTSILQLILLFAVAFGRRWLTPFNDGIFSNWAFRNKTAVKHMLKVTIPLSIGAVLNNAEWTVLAVFAAHIGEAEVAAWGILGIMWELSDSMVSGIGDAAEIRVSYHLGNNHPMAAKLAAYKSLVYAMIMSFIMSFVLYINIDNIPPLFTDDEVLQFMLSQALPYFVVGNIAITFGYLCWFVLGAQGKYKLGTWINFIVSWCVTIPLAFIFIYIKGWNLESLTASVVLGYCAMCAFVAYSVLITNWEKVAKKIHENNLEEDSDTDDDDSDDDDEDENVKMERNYNEAMKHYAYAALNSKKSRGALATARQNLLVVAAPPGLLHIRVGKMDHIDGAIVLEVYTASAFYNQIFPGDIIIGLNGTNVKKFSAEQFYTLANESQHKVRSLTLITPPKHCHDEYESDNDHDDDDNSQEVLLMRCQSDISDFDLT